MGEKANYKILFTINYILLKITGQWKHYFTNNNNDNNNNNFLKLKITNLLLITKLTIKSYLQYILLLFSLKKTIQSKYYL